MAEVYRARDTKLDRGVAVKVLPPQLAENADALARFEREAKAVAALSHPNRACRPADRRTNGRPRRRAQHADAGLRFILTTVADDPSVYAYVTSQRVSTLFMVAGAR
jgi:serine/threonine protein kinase